MIGNIYSIRGIEAFVKRHSEDLKLLFKTGKNGLPSFYVLRTVLLHLDYDELAQIVCSWLIENKFISKNELLSIDGKSTRSTITNSSNSNQSFSIIASVFAQISGIALLSAKFNSKETSEIDVVEYLIKHLKIENRTITLDALHCKKNFRDDYREQKQLRCFRQGQ